MATTFLEPGGDADFAVAGTTGFWNSPFGNISGTIATDFVHGSHIKSIKYAPNTSQKVTSPSVLADAGSRISMYIYLVALPSSTTAIFSGHTSTGTDNDVFQIKITSGGVLQLFETTSQIGSNGATLSTGIWYRISIAYTITSTTVNRFEVFKDGVSTISVTNATITNQVGIYLFIGNLALNSTLDFRSSDHYVDSSAALTDPGNIWVTAKRPNANGTTNGFTTQIGAGGSGYGTGHSPQVNERPLSNTNGWSMVGAGSAITEEYNIESKSTGDIDISTATIVDYLGWVDAKAALSETASIIVNNVTSNVLLTSGEGLFTKIAGSSTYPAGTGTDIGLITATTVTTVSLYECGVIVAYIPAVVTPTVFNNTKFYQLLGAGT